MYTKFDQSLNWLELARQANWSVGKMAKLCRVSPRTLERSFLKNAGKSPKVWLSEQRQLCAIELLYKNNKSVKEIAAQLGYKKPHHFSQEFRKYWDVYPTKFFASREL